MRPTGTYGIMWVITSAATDSERPSTVPYGYCWCGCGERTATAKQNDTKLGLVKGEPRKYRKGHVRRRFQLEGEGPNPSGLCMCGCGEPAPIASHGSVERGWVKGRPIRYVHGHACRGVPRHDGPDYEVDEATGCWNWLWNLSHGRGYVKAHGLKTLAYRAMWESANGPIPEGHEMHHKCENPACVNPAHLEAVTPKEHVERHRTRDAA